VLISTEIAATVAMGPGQMPSTHSRAIGRAAAGSNLILFRLPASAGFALQSRTNLTSGNWVTVASPALQIPGTNFQVKLATTNTELFFRLFKWSPADRNREKACRHRICFHENF
jgi:hypothetical protein